MAVRSSGPFPEESLATPEGGVRPVTHTFASGDTLIVYGHRNCKTTRQTLPYVDRIHRGRTRGTVLAILQDDAETAAALVKEQGLDLPVLLEADPYPLAAAVSLEVVPTLFLVRQGGQIDSAVQAFDRKALEAFAACASGARR